MPATREEKKEWWLANGKTVEAEATKKKEARIAALKSKKGFKLPDKSYRLIYLDLLEFRIARVQIGNPITVTVVTANPIKKPIGALITRLVTDGPFDRMEFSWSAVHMPEDSFDKNEGRNKALEHLDTKPNAVRGAKGTNPFMLKACATAYLAGKPFPCKGVELIEDDGRIIPKNIRLVAKQWLQNVQSELRYGIGRLPNKENNV